MTELSFVVENAEESKAGKFNMLDEAILKLYAHHLLIPIPPSIVPDIAFPVCGAFSSPVFSDSCVGLKGSGGGGGGGVGDFTIWLQSGFMPF